MSVFADFESAVQQTLQEGDLTDREKRIVSAWVVFSMDAIGASEADLPAYFSGKVIDFVQDILDS